MVSAFQSNAFQATAFQTGSNVANDFVGTDLFDYIWQYPDQGSFQRDPILSLTMAQFRVTGVSLLVYNPVETLQPRSLPSIGNPLVLPPQLADSTAALPGYWALTTFRGVSPTLNAMPHVRIVNNRTSMFARQPSVYQTNMDVSHVNVIINSFGVYVADGLLPADIILTDDTGTIELTTDSGAEVLVAG